MKLKLKIRLTLLSLLLLGVVKAQTNIFPYQRNLKGVTTNWHSLQLPNSVFSKAQSGLEDLRIFGFKGKDTIEVPYILEQSADQVTQRETPFNVINQSNNGVGFYYTFQASAAASINEIKLSFKETNFDWKVTLEGSSNNTEWFTILKDERILSIKNNNTNYQFTTLNFPTAKYAYFRLTIKTNLQPTLTAAKILQTDTLKGIEKEVAYQTYQLSNDAKNKQTVIDVVLPELAPVAYLKINAQSNLDFYRRFRIEYATDSFKTEKGIQFNYAPLFEGTLSSLEPTAFSFKSTLLSRLKITIENNDNQPLRLNGLQLKGPIYELVARFEKNDYQYALYYGNKETAAPIYELQNFENKTPIAPAVLALGNEQKNPAYNIKTTTALFENKIWLWALMGLIIALLGFFAYKMLKEK